MIRAEGGESEGGGEKFGVRSWSEKIIAIALVERFAGGYVGHLNAPVSFFRGGISQSGLNTSVETGRI